MLFCKNTWNVVIFNADGQRKDDLVKTSMGVTLSLASYWKMLLPHSISHLKHTAAHALFMQQWVNERDAALSIQEPFPVVTLWVKEGKKPWCSLSIRWQSDRDFFFNYHGNKVIWSATTPQYMWDVPQFSQQLMYVCICVCVCVWHQYVRGVLSSCVQWRSSDGDRLKVTVRELRWSWVRSVAEPDERRAQGGVNLATKCYLLPTTGVVTADRC